MRAFMGNSSLHMNGFNQGLELRLQRPSLKSTSNSQMLPKIIRGSYSSAQLNQQKTKSHTSRWDPGFVIGVKCNNSRLNRGLRVYFVLYASEFQKSTFSPQDFFNPKQTNFKVGPWLCYWSKMHHILAQQRFEGIFSFVCVGFPKSNFFTLVLFGPI